MALNPPLDANGNVKTNTTVTLPTAGSVTPGTAATKSDLVGAQFNTVAPAPTNGQQTALQGDAAGNLLASLEGRKATYRYVAQMSFAAANQVMWQLSGSTTKKVKVTRMIISGELTTAGSVRYTLQKLSALSTGGTSATQTPIALDSNDAAATAVLKTYTVAPTTGVLVGNVVEGLVLLNAPATVMVTDRLEFDFGTPAIGAKPCTLNSATEAVALIQNAGGTSLTGLFLTVTVEWTEE